ncbi:STAS-like domain-containing protein [Kaistella montana]|uniref:STAS-like domain-containing protein n=1 Tax=Kaistella montana TaxID=1849733 RepID=A0ABW5K9X6_9FLAO|nr:STAS-like domain-containing protein [Kaistella montana]MCQ4035496.1 STAS-like domain-containing protein [Kaistella montana]
MIHLKVIDVIGTDLAVSTENGNLVYEQIQRHLEKDESVNLDFEGISLIITAFLNAAIGSLFKDQKYSGDFLNSKVFLSNVDSNDVSLFRDVINRAKEYFANKDFFEKNNNESIYGGS